MLQSCSLALFAHCTRAINQSLAKTTGKGVRSECPIMELRLNGSLIVEQFRYKVPRTVFSNNLSINFSTAAIGV